ncbi:MAG TPA: STAS domain-containing protein [Vicinamibacterales bacterium]|nr:STAS domain-containing protein [Vicinamibacterales bacterium]
MHWTEINLRSADGAIVLDLRGHLTLSDEEQRLMLRIGELAAQGHQRFLLNLAQVSYIDSTGIGEIVGAYTRVRRQGGQLAISNAGPRVREVLQATSLDTVLQLFEREEDALRSLQPGGQHG